MSKSEAKVGIYVNEGGQEEQGEDDLGWIPADDLGDEGHNQEEEAPKDDEKEITCEPCEERGS